MDSGFTLSVGGVKPRPAGRGYKPPLNC
jgi:hypothetical protein